MISNGGGVVRNYRNIEAWKIAHALALEVYQCTNNFPKREVFTLTSQIRRAVVSAPANIVEGASRGTRQDYLRFLYIARGSLLETEYFLSLSHDLEYLNDEDYRRLNQMLDRCSRVLYGLIKFMEAEQKK